MDKGEAEKEREAIVAWLRGEAGDAMGRVCGAEIGPAATQLADHLIWMVETIADRVERGDHLQETSRG